MRELGRSVGKGTLLEAEDEFADYHEDYLSPDETVLVAFGINEVRASHWLYEPVIQDRSSGETVFSPDGMWDGSDFEFLSSGHIRMYLLQYPGRRAGVSAVFDPQDWSVTHTLVGVEGRPLEFTTESAKSFAKRLGAVPLAS